MEGVIINYRGSHKTQYSNQMIIKIIDVDDKEKASSLSGKKVTWTSPAGKEITGKVTKVHGSKGAVRVKFEKGLPGQAIGSRVKIE